MESLRSRGIDLLAPVVRGPLVSHMLDGLLRARAAAVSRADSVEALRQLVILHDRLFERIDFIAAGLDGGVHVKHRLTGYHDFFVGRVEPGQRVLDVGTGKGELARDLALRAGATVTGIDVNRSMLAFAAAHSAHARVEYVLVDVWELEPAHPYDVVVLSNVLEHLDRRPELLRRLARSTGAFTFLIRVPLLERDWLVALRRELGLPHFSDPTHTTEYTPESFAAELDEAGLDVAELQLRWGEIWARARPRSDG
jgi:2-polyprenyl-3-methyl-5-hydroxy-6-metoxy-1,4-benzoquinol methylase